MKRFLKKQAHRFWRPFKKDNAQTLFIFAHPRSGSSLLMHILADHPQIAGYGEYFTAYNDQGAYDLAAFDIRRKSKSLFRPVKYVVNQVNHHSVTPNLELVRQNVFCIFLYRQAQETLSSMLELSDFKGHPMTQEEVTQNYVRRLKDLRELAAQLPPGQQAVLSYEQLLQQPEASLDMIATKLQLDAPLKVHTQTKKFTGVWGDPSTHISKGAIVKTHSLQRSILPELLKKANDAHQQTLRFFEKHKPGS